MIFNSEKEFEDSLVEELQKGSWKTVINNPTEEVLWSNLRNIINSHNKGEKELNDCPLTDTEFEQIKNQISDIGKDPCKANDFIKGELISIFRDNPDDVAHLNQEVYLKIYNVDAISSGKCVYQIVRQPKFNIDDSIYPQRRGDVELLINGLPLVHIELKNHDIPINKAFYQMKKYCNENAFTGIWSTLQVMVAMNPEEAKYFANPGIIEKYSEKNMFNWEDSDNNLINVWDNFANTFLSIPLIQTLIGYYTSVDKKENDLLIFRSYQYWAAERIVDRLKEIDWDRTNNLGGYIWHTMSSGKTLTSLKVSELILRKKAADKVCFLTPRNELGTQTFGEYTNYAEDEDDIISVESTDILIGKLKNPDSIIITPSIQKMGKIIERVKSNDKEIIDKKRLVIMVDECHFSVYGDLMSNIKQMFPHAVFLGFTGTPITDLNRDIIAKTSDVFGDELRRYTASEAMRDKNILKFNKEGIPVFKNSETREKIGLHLCHATSLDEIFSDEEKKKKYLEIQSWSMDKIESYIPKSEFNKDSYREIVVEHIKDVYESITVGRKFHSLFATSSIKEAILYWNLIRNIMPDLKVTAVFDSSDGNDEDGIFKLESMKDILKYYNDKYNKHYNLSANGYDQYRKDVANRIRHKQQYQNIEKENYIDMIIVVDQMLEGFDSHYINTLFMDKVLDEEHLIQAFSRTIRKCDDDKTQGNIIYFRKPYTMDKNVEYALKIYSGTNAPELFVDKLATNVEKLNAYYQLISTVFVNDGIDNFSELPKTPGGIKEFVNNFNKLNKCLVSAKVQGFNWNKTEYFNDNEKVILEFDKHAYDTLLQRYNDIRYLSDKSGLGDFTDNLPYDLQPYIIEGIEEIIDADYLNERFIKWKQARLEDNSESIKKALEELRSTFVQLSKEDKEYAEKFISDVEFGNAIPDENKTLKDYILEYKVEKKNQLIQKFIETFDISYDDVNELIKSNPRTLREANINRRLDKIKDQITEKNINKVVEYFNSKNNNKYENWEAVTLFNELLTNFILSGGMEI